MRGTPAPARRSRMLAFARRRELLALPDVDPVVLALERLHKLAAFEQRADEIRSRYRPARRDELQDRRIQRVDAAVHLARQRRLLVEADHAIAITFDAPERDRVEVATDAD